MSRCGCERPGPAGAGARASRPCQVLLVEDDGLMVAVAHVLLQDSDFTIAHTARDVASALLALEEVRPDVVLLDHDLPDGTAADVVPVVRRLHPGVPVLLWTASTDITARAEALDVEAALAKADARTGLLPRLARLCPRG